VLHIFSSFLKFISSYQINVRVLLANHQKNKAVSNIISFEKPYYSMLKVNLEDTTGNIVVALDVIAPSPSIPAHFHAQSQVRVNGD